MWFDTTMPTGFRSFDALLLFDIQNILFLYWQPQLTVTSSFLSFVFSCIEFPDCWGRDGPERWAVSSEWQLWIHSKAQFHEIGWEKIWPGDTTQTGQLQTHRPHRTGTVCSGYFTHLWGISLIVFMYLRWSVVSSCPKSISKKTL